MGQDGYNAVFQRGECLYSTLAGPGTFLELLKHSGDAVAISGLVPLVQG